MRRHHDDIEVRLGLPFGSAVNKAAANGTAANGTAVNRAAATSVLDREHVPDDLGDPDELDRDDLDRDDQGPAQFIWRDRLWRVLTVESRWVESGAWWASPAVRAARGDEVSETRQSSAAQPSSQYPSPDSSDLLCEVEVWRVEAANGMAGSRGVYELAHAWATGAWQLRAVLD